MQVSATQKQVLDAIIRLTVGWQKTESHITSSKIGQMTGLRTDNIARKIVVLAERKIIFVQPGTRHLIKINTDYGQWIYKKAKPKPVVSILEITEKAKPKAATIPKSRTVAKPARKVTPAWFKELWQMYPARLRGGNYAAGWRKWQSGGLTEEDANKAIKWLVAAAAANPDWGPESKGGYILGLVNFIGDTRWCAPVPTKPTSQGGGYKPPDLDNMDYKKGWKGFEVVGR